MTSYWLRQIQLVQNGALNLMTSGFITATTAQVSRKRGRAGGAAHTTGGQGATARAVEVVEEEGDEHPSSGVIDVAQDTRRLFLATEEDNGHYQCIQWAGNILR